MTLAADEFMRRFLLHVLPGGFHRIRHYGLLANAERKNNLAKLRTLLQVLPPDDVRTEDAAAPSSAVPATFVCPHCGGAMHVIEILMRVRPIRAPPQHRVPPCK
jgi:hypothetical protein